MILIGTAGWSIPKQFAQEGEAHLHTYSELLNCCEINSTFYKNPLARTLTKWKTITAEDFSFSLKLHQSFTHFSELKPSASELKKTLNLYKQLGEKLGCLLLQFPPKMSFDTKKMERFYAILRQSLTIPIVIEPRNTTWKTADSLSLMRDYSISKVIADPEKCPGKSYNFSGVKYYRLHGAPVIYRSSYTEKFLRELSSEVLKSRKDCWIIFDNTASGAGFKNAWSLNKKSRP